MIYGLLNSSKTINWFNKTVQLWPDRPYHWSLDGEVSVGSLANGVNKGAVFE